MNCASRFISAIATSALLVTIWTIINRTGTKTEDVIIEQWDKPFRTTKAETPTEEWRKFTNRHFLVGVLPQIWRKRIIFCWSRGSEGIFRLVAESELEKAKVAPNRLPTAV